jgi:hypothetical protein
MQPFAFFKKKQGSRVRNKDNSTKKAAKSTALHTFQLTNSLPLRKTSVSRCKLQSWHIKTSPFRELGGS